MKLRESHFLIAGFFIAFAISAKAQSQVESSVECTQDNSIFLGMFYSSSYGRISRMKCKFSNINSLDQLPSALTKKVVNIANVVAISFNQSNLSTLPDRAFASYSNLRSLDVSSLRLTDITSNVFSALKSLDSLDLSFNNLTALPSKVFAGAKYKELDLSYNMIAVIHETAFLSSEIDKIDLSFNKLKATGFINSFKFFNYLQINDNEILTFDKIVISPSAWGNSQQSLNFIPQYPSINVQNNKFTKIDCSSSLQIMLMDLSRNLLLKEVKLNDCEVTSIDVSNCEQLKTMTLTEKVSGFTAENVQFERLEIPEKNSLITLTLVNNSLTPDVISSISKLENLTYLELSYNHIGRLNISTFAKLKKLQSLKLKATNISDIIFGTFSHQSSLKELDISDNNLGIFDMHMIYTMHGLTTLDLAGNNLIELANLDNAHLTFSILEKIDLTNNKWSCRYLMRLIRILKTYRVSLIHSSIEEHHSNINGIYCDHVEGEDSEIAPLEPENANFTEIRNKLNEVIASVSKLRENVAALERRVDKETTKTAALSTSSNEKLISGDLQVKNSTLLEFSLIIVCACFTVFMALQIISYVKRNFLSRPRPMRGTTSEHTLTMNDDY
jgi:Leucine-rich repeat (LRR) protein